MRELEEIHRLIRDRSTLSAAGTEAIIEKRFRSLPRRLVEAERYWSVEGKRVLDVGCSYGHCLVHFGPGSVGLDNVPEHVEFCRSIGLTAQLVDVDLGLGPVADGAFDLIWVSDLLEHLDAPRLLLRRLAPKLAPAGRLIVYMNLLPRSRLARRAFRGRGFFDAQVHHYQFTYETGRYLIERAGWSVERVVVPVAPAAPKLLDRLALPIAPVAFFSARPDERAEEVTVAAESRNKPVRIGSGA